MSWTVDDSTRARLVRWPLANACGLGPRLSALALLLPERARSVADVGADHGQLGAGLLRARRVDRVLAIDRSESALAGARAALACAIEDGSAHALHGDGLVPMASAPAPWNRVDAAFLAGLGGPAIAGILDRAAEVGALPASVVTQPLTGHHLVRLALARHGYEPVDERLDLDGRRLVATALHARINGSAMQAPEGPALWIGDGLIRSAASDPRDAEHLDAWCEVQRQWLARCPPGEQSTARARGIRAALDSIENERSA